MLSPAARAVTQLKRGEVAPAIVLKDVRGQEVATQQFRGRIVVVVFGETYHDKTRHACEQIDAVLRDARLKDGPPVVPLLITAQVPVQGQQRQPPPLSTPGAMVVLDPARQAFGDYQVAVMPSVVIIDREGRVVHALAGTTPRFADILTDAILLASEKLSAAQFEAALHPQSASQPADSDAERAQRIAQLGRQLARRNLDDMAAEKLREALQIDPHLADAHLQLGSLMIKNQRLAEAEAHFRAVLAEHPASPKAALGLAFVQTLRGGSEVNEAEKTVRDLLARDPSQPRAHYLYGLIQEQRGRQEEAAASYKRAAQLLMERSGFDDQE
jgi:Flp pilus assembly protein TadD